MGSHGGQYTTLENVPCLGTGGPQQAYHTPAEIKRTARVVITEQPASKALRFRYESEGRCTGSIVGINSGSKSKTYPTIKVLGYVGKCYVYVSCVTKDFPYRPHPHHLVGKEGCIGGVCKVDIPTETMTATFTGLSIRCVKKKDIDESLRIRKRINVDPFHTGFDANRPTPIDLNVVRLCFQVVVETQTEKVSLQPIVSEPIINKKVHSDLRIAKLSHCVAPADGGTEIIMLCEKVDRDDIEVRLYEEVNGQVIWENHGIFHSSDVHKQVAISFKTPPYCRTDINEGVKVNIQLRRPSDGAVGEPVPFEYVRPVILGYNAYSKKRKSLNLVNCSNILKTAPHTNPNDRRGSYELEYAVNMPNPQMLMVDKKELSPVSTRQPSPLPLDEAAGYQLTTLTSTNHLDFPLMNNINGLTNLPDSWNIGTDIKVQNIEFLPSNVVPQEWALKPITTCGDSPMWNVPVTTQCPLTTQTVTQNQAFQLNPNKLEDDLCNYAMDINTLSDSFSMSFSLTDLDQGVQTDSLTNILDRAAEKHCKFDVCA